MWSREHEYCQTCRQTDSPHMASGLCRRCYLRQYRTANAARIAQLKSEWHYRYHEDNLLKLKMAREDRHFGGLREAVLIRDKYRCVRCRSRHRLVVHHRDRQGRGKQAPHNKLENLETLCRGCHLKEHRDETLKARRQKHSTPQLLKCGRWSLQYDACVKCGQTYSKHASKGVCMACYQVRYRQKMT